jgi:hypothetical protein
MEVNMKKLVVLCLLFYMVVPCFAETRGAPYTPEQLRKMSTLVFEGTVTKIETVEKYKKSFPTSAKISKVLKGTLKEKNLSFKHKDPGRCVIFEKEYNTPTIGQEGMFYLQNQGGALVLIAYIKKAELKEISPIDKSNVLNQRDPVLSLTEKAIKSAVAISIPNLKLTFEYPKHSKSLVVKYKTRKFMIHSGSKIGRYSEKAHEEEGPSYQGFLLSLHLQKKGIVNQVVIPQTIRQPYWRTDLNVTIVDKSDRQLYWGLSYGSRTDEKLLAIVRKAVNSMGHPYSWDKHGTASHAVTHQP